MYREYIYLYKYEFRLRFEKEENPTTKMAMHDGVRYGITINAISDGVGEFDSSVFKKHLHRNSACSIVYISATHFEIVHGYERARDRDE